MQKFNFRKLKATASGKVNKPWTPHGSHGERTKADDIGAITAHSLNYSHCWRLFELTADSRQLTEKSEWKAIMQLVCDNNMWQMKRLAEFFATHDVCWLFELQINSFMLIDEIALLPSHMKPFISARDFAKCRLPVRRESKFLGNWFRQSLRGNEA